MKRKKLGYQGYSGLLIDGCSTNTNRYIEEFLYDYGIFLHKIPAHTLDQFQPLDLRIFHILKKQIIKINAPKWLNSQTKNIFKLLYSLSSSNSPPIIVSVFFL